MTSYLLITQDIVLLYLRGAFDGHSIMLTASCGQPTNCPVLSVQPAQRGKLTHRRDFNLSTYWPSKALEHLTQTDSPPNSPHLFGALQILTGATQQ